MSIQEKKFIDLLIDYKVVIPPIQRDYAQGRKSTDIKRIRQKFLNDITSVLIQESKTPPLKLDFIYGYSINDNTGYGQSVSVFKPLDGQQRLTTLFLLHWFAAAYENKLDDYYRSILSKFTYAVRAKCRKFCEHLVGFTPEFHDGSPSIKYQIENQAWFFRSWDSDPTISSMLVMLNDIEDYFKNHKLENVWFKLIGDSPRIVFYLLSMNDLGLPEDLYIKMNSRGKALTNFEHFKSQFSKIIPSTTRAEFNIKIDNQWSDLFWSLHKDKDLNDIAASVDASFLRFYNYITDLLIVTKDIDISDSYWLTTARDVYANNKDNVIFLFQCLDLFVTQRAHHPNYFHEYLYIVKSDFSKVRTRIFFQQPSEDLFSKCSQVYDNTHRSNPFSIGEQLLLYAFILNLKNSINNFSTKIRRIRNLIASSEDQLRKDNLKDLYTEIEYILFNSSVRESRLFSKHQIQEEIDKTAFINQFENLEETIYRLEDHRILRGSIAIIGLDEIDVYSRLFDIAFKEHSENDLLMTSRAMTTIGNYSQQYGGRKWRFGTRKESSWRELFTKSDRRQGFDNTSSILKRYLLSSITNDEVFNEQLIESYSPISYPWRFYFSKYLGFHKYSKGFYYWESRDLKPYECFMINQETFRGKYWDPFLLELSTLYPDNCRLEEYGEPLLFSHLNCIINIKMLNDRFVFFASESDSDSKDFMKQLISKEILDPDSNLLIPQNDQGVDLIDRIKLCSNTFDKIINFK